MKKICVSAALIVAAGLTHAQRAITLYGIVDTGVEYYDHAAGGGSFAGMPSLTGEVPSRFGLRGSEDLGGGYEAFFVLENGFAVDTGSLNLYGGRLFGRQANVGVSGAPGTLTLGRQMNMTMYALQNADVIGPSLHSMATFDSYLPNARSDNAIGYMGKFDGFTVGGTYSFGRDAAGPEGPAATNCSGQVPGQHPRLPAVHRVTRIRRSALRRRSFIRRDAWRRRSVGAAIEQRVHGYANDRRRLRQVRRRKGWRGMVTSKHVGSHPTPQSDLYFLGVTYSFSPAVSFDGQVAHYELRNQYNSNLLVARANYFLSRRTTLYTSVGYMLNGRLAAEPVAVGGSVETGMNQVGVMLGIQQRF